MARIFNLPAALILTIIASTLAHGFVNPPQWVEASNDVLLQLDTSEWTIDQKNATLISAMARIEGKCGQEGDPACFRTEAGKIANEIRNNK